MWQKESSILGHGKTHLGLFKSTSYRCTKVVFLLTSVEAGPQNCVHVFLLSGLAEDQPKTSRKPTEDACHKFLSHT